MARARCIAVRLKFESEQKVFHEKAFEILHLLAQLLDTYHVQKQEWYGLVVKTGKGIVLSIDTCELSIEIEYRPFIADMSIVRELVRNLVMKLGRPTEIVYVLEKELEW